MFDPVCKRFDRHEYSMSAEHVAEAVKEYLCAVRGSILNDSAEVQLQPDGSAKVIVEYTVNAYLGEPTNG